MAVGSSLMTMTFSLTYVVHQQTGRSEIIVKALDYFTSLRLVKVCVGVNVVPKVIVSKLSDAV